jgi:threonine dehydrogenase-like Zn-dependent dehydrogenase
VRAVTWHGFADVRVEEVPDPKIEEPTDALVEITSTAICGSDLHPYRPLTPFMEPGDVLGHEPMGRVAEVGAEVEGIQAVAYAEVPPGGSLAVLGLGPVGQMACRIAIHQGVEQVIGVDLVPERLAMARRHGVETVDAGYVDDIAEHLRGLTGGRGPDVVVDAVGMEAHGPPVAGALQRATAAVPMVELFDKGVRVRMGQAHVKRWVPEMPLLEADDHVFGLADFVTHRMPLDDAAAVYAMFQAEEDGAIKVGALALMPPRHALGAR